MHKFKHISCLFYLLPGHLLAFSQDRLLVHVTTKDGKPLPYASVIWGKNEGLVSDTSGYLQIPDKNKVDSLIITAIGFNGKVITKEDILDKSKIDINLERSIVALPEIMVAQYDLKKDVGVVDLKKETSYFKNAICINLQSALLINSYHYPAQCKSISVFISSESSVKVPYRLRLYEIGLDGLPGKDLIAQNIIINWYKKNKWNTYSFDSSIIQLPQNGFFVALEWLCNDIKVQNGLCVGLTNKIDKALTYYKYGNIGWFQLKFKNDTYHDNVMLKTTLVTIK